MRAVIPALLTAVTGLAGCAAEVLLDGEGSSASGADRADDEDGTGGRAATGAGGSAPAAGSTGAGGGAPRRDDELDAGEVYLVGTLNEGSCSRSALAHWSTPDAPVVGFECEMDPRRAWIRPVDGRLLYLSAFESPLRELVCDLCPFDVADADEALARYPEEPLANDPVHALTPCSDADGTVPAFVLAPDGSRLHSCWSGHGPWYDAAGRLVLAADVGLTHLGHDGIALTDRGAVVDLTSGAITPIPWEMPFIIRTARALPAPDAFLLVLDHTDAGEGGDQHLWKVDRSGHPVLVGPYPALPAGVTQVQPWSSKLDASGAVLQLGTGADALQDVIVRRSVDGASAVVYDEAAEPLVRVHASALVTGP